MVQQKETEGKVVKAEGEQNKAGLMF